eukprot:TRINITY_DN12864_c0_g1_i1.p1 TRINITY_DN12864_c0_g1~~TRINITY_DN12864_c0_g1_i1.p1  ORF type:complete len:141 (-),score=14.04 TRINITY_DN12864_c0_g1_i1:498-920(-)
MPLYSLYIYDRTGTCLFYEQWQRKRQAVNLKEEQKLVYGLLFILKQFSQKLSPKQPTDGFQRFTTNTYKMHYLETPSGIRFVITTDTSVGDLKDVLRHIYGQFFVELVVKSPSYQPGAPIQTEGFSTALNQFVRTLPFFS